MKKAVENPWCIRKGVMHFPIGIGKIESEDESSACVRYSEGQHYDPQIWEKEFLERFATFEEMVQKYSEYENLSPELMMDDCLHYFPSQKNFS